MIVVVDIRLAKYHVYLEAILAGQGLYRCVQLLLQATMLCSYRIMADSQREKENPDTSRTPGKICTICNRKNGKTRMRISFFCSIS